MPSPTRTLAATPAPMPSPDLRTQFASHPVPVQAGTTLRRILFATLDRADRVPADRTDVWEQFLRILEQNRSDPRSTARCAVLANLVALVTFDEPSDYAATVELATQLGQDRLARLQHRASVALETDPSMPWTTTAVRRLVEWDLEDRLGAPVATDDRAEGADRAGDSEHIATTCAVIAQNLVFEDIDPGRAVESLRTLAELHDLVDHGTVVAWRTHLGAVAASPWGPYADTLLELGRASDRASVLATIAAAVEQCQEWCRERERDQVAREIRHLVAVSGASQREFASRIGTSPSRLSTYVRGTVTPSAAMLLRIQRASRMLQRQAPHRTVLAPRR